MKLLSYNVNGIRAALKKGFASWLEATQADIICIQETKAMESQVDTTILEEIGYHHFWFSAQKKGYSGVATFCKDEPLDVQYGLGIEKYDREGRVLITEFENFLLYNIYFPNGQKDEHRLQYKLDFYDDLLVILNVSSPPQPIRVSLPAPPLKVSSPAPPINMSFPDVPLRV